MEINTNQKVQVADKPKAYKPAFIGNGVAVWLNTDKNGSMYLSVKILGMKAINCFRNKPRIETLQEMADEPQLEEVPQGQAGVVPL